VQIKEQIDIAPSIVMMLEYVNKLKENHTSDSDKDSDDESGPRIMGSRRSVNDSRDDDYHEERVHKRVHKPDSSITVVSTSSVGQINES